MKRRKLSAHEVAVLFRVRDQLERIRNPEKYREAEVTAPTVAEFKTADRTICMMEVVWPKVRSAPFYGFITEAK